MTPDQIDELGRCESCGRLVIEANLTEFLGDMLCVDCLERAKDEYHLVGWDVD